MSWPLVKIGDVAEFIRNGLSINQTDSKEGLPITRIETIADREINIERCGYAGLRRGDADEYLLNKGDILISHINSEKHLAKCAIFELGGVDLIHGMNLLCLRPALGSIFPKYLFYCLSDDTFLRQIKKITKKSVNQASFTVPSFKELELPLPPLEEQKRIAAILDKADAIRRKRQQAIKLADDFLRSVFLEMFGDPVTNPREWKVDYLPNIGTFKNGLNYGKDESGVNIFCLGVGDFKSLDRIDSVQLLSKVSLNSAPSDDYLLRDGDLVFVRSNGNGALVGRCLSVYPGNEKLTFSGFCIRFRTVRQDVSPDYLNYLFRMPSIKHEMLKGGQGANIQNINQQKLSEIKIPIPPEKLQIKFAHLVNSFKCAFNRNNSSFDEIQNLLSALSKKAFSGEL